MLIWYMNAKIIIGRVLKMLVAEIGCLLQAAEKESDREAFCGVVFLLTRHEKIITSTINMLIITLKKLVNLSDVSVRGIEIGNTMTKVKNRTQMIYPFLVFAHQAGKVLPWGRRMDSRTWGIIVLNRTM